VRQFTTKTFTKVVFAQSGSSSTVVLMVSSKIALTKSGFFVKTKSEAVSWSILIPSSARLAASSEAVEPFA